MKINKNKTGSISIIFDSAELDRFLHVCLKPWQGSSIKYFHELLDRLGEKVEEWNVAESKRINFYAASKDDTINKLVNALNKKTD